MLLITANNEYALGEAKLIIYQSKIYFEYHSDGYKVYENDCKKIKRELENIPGLTLRRI